MPLPALARSRHWLAATIGGLAFMAAGPALAEPRPLDVPYVPTPQAVVDRMLELGQVSRDTYVIDLGSGDGRIPVTAAQRYGARALGVDLNPERIREANTNARQNGVTDKVTFKEQNLFDTPIGEAQVLTMYLLPNINLQLRPRILQLRPRILEELQPGARVVSHAFTMQEWEPDHQETVGTSNLYLWVVPARVAGTWQVQADQPFTLALDQEFQKVSGSATVDGRQVPLADVTLRGAELTFTLDGQRHTARVNGRAMQASGWTATRTS
ncbi:MAG: Geranyl diphosphate 2-C-methyltransferase [Paracidovorax wautersii]|uniref:Geranyl diphosphate 2-C-methyltransferase n=1 Tax=Paracidovorax wautersii TaxID=1177982 RepID=A0A7V8FQ77_9BURK|nr:MAG: Geranyl diphosphate 2-C-methyltransferase [Paracidovorax wautersii]